MKVTELRVNGRQTPLGLDDRKPAFSWMIAAAPQKRAVRQHSYRILVASNPKLLAQREADVWDSGIAESRRQTGVAYDGPALASRKRYYWLVEVWDGAGSTGVSATSWWEMALLEAEDWQAQWIAPPLLNQPGYSVGKAVSPKLARLLDEYGGSDALGAPLLMPCFRREFSVTGELIRARLYACGLGQHELRLNGAKVEDHLLAPAWTHYDHSCLYEVFDATALLQQGVNALGILLGNGFFHVGGTRYTKFKDSFGPLRCLVQLELEYAGGRREIIASGTDWQVAASPITYSCIYGGEDYDARLEQPGWDRPGFTADSRWRQAIPAEAPKGQLACRPIPPLRAVGTYEPVQTTALQPGVYVLDLGQNFSGIASITVQGTAGSRVRLTPAELLDEAGNVNQKWTGSPCEWNYTLRGDGPESWRPRFSYSGFRYIRVEGVNIAGVGESVPGLPELTALEGCLIAPEPERQGELSTSLPLLDRIHQLILAAMVSNTKSVYTDCPHREKLAWLEQVHLMGPALVYNSDQEAMFIKVMEDMRQAQLDNGMIPTTAPEYVVFEPPWDVFRHSVSWGAAYILTGWNLYTLYGQTAPLLRHYPYMKRYLAYLEEASDDLIIRDGLGDWYDVGDQGPGFAQNTPVALPETAMFYHLADILSQVAGVLREEADRKRYRQLANRISDAYHAAFYDEDSARYATGSQAAQAMSLALGLTPEAERARVFAILTEDILAHDCHTTAGDVAHRYVLQTLADHGRSDLVLRMALQTDYPSYGYQLAHGATALTEAWDGPTVGKSQNHFMLGHLDEWLFRSLAGIRYALQQDTEAFHLTVMPHYTSELDGVRAQVVTPAGEAAVHWRLAGGLLEIEALIPANATAELHLPGPLPDGSMDTIRESGRPLTGCTGLMDAESAPGSTVLTLASGRYHFTCEWRQSYDHPSIAGSLSDAL